MNRRTPSLWALALAATIVGAHHGAASAQPPRPDTGYELALHGPATAVAGHGASLSGVAYRVRGLSELLPYAGPVRARCRTETVDLPPFEAVRSAADGRFEVTVPVCPMSDDAPRLEVEVGPEGAARSFTFGLHVRAPWALDLRSDRALYEPGEEVHVWMLARDAVSGAPAVGRAVRFAFEGLPVEGRTDEAITSEAGVASLSFTLPAGAQGGGVRVVATVDGAAAQASFRVGRRAWERLFARVEIEPAEVAPGAPATARVAVTTPDAVPVRDASVRVSLDGVAVDCGATSTGGEARCTVLAPAHAASETGVVAVRARVTHPAHGEVAAVGVMHVAVPLALTVNVLPAHAVLVPEIDDVVFVQLQDARGNPPPPGTSVEVEGVAVPGGRAQAEVDANGLAQVPVRLPIEAGAGGAGAHTTLLVKVRGAALERTARIAVPVQRGVEVVPTLSHALVAPGASVEVQLARRTSASRRPIVLRWTAEDDGALLGTVVVPPGTSRLRLPVPAGRLGRVWLRAAAVHGDEVMEGPGGSDSVLVRPAGPDFPTLVPERARVRVGEAARVALRTRPGARAWGAVLVRDLAAHGGEADFAGYFLSRAFDRALLEADGAVGERLVRATLAASARPDEAPRSASPLLDALGLPREDGAFDGASFAEGTLRDPWPLARELERRGIGPMMRTLEGALADALEHGTLDEITELRGSERRFRDELLRDAGFATLGDVPVTAAMIEEVDPSFSYDAAARRVARARLVRLLAGLAVFLDPGDDAGIAARAAAREPWQRWLQRMVEHGALDAAALDDPWGGRFVLRPTRSPGIVLSSRAAQVELVSPGPDRRVGTADDVRSPFVRVVPQGTPYAVASGEDALMRRLAVLSPAQRTLEAWLVSYARSNEEVREDEVGDAVAASVSEGTLGLGDIGTIGHGAGYGSGSGYGAGGGAMRSRMAAPAAARGPGQSALSGLLRSRFPPTVHFRPEFSVDPSGTTTLVIPLAEAVTTYRVEVILWREDGWIWSARTEVASDRDVVVDAPVPPVARLGDRLALPVRVQNRGAQPVTVAVEIAAAEAFAFEAAAPTQVTIAPGSAVRVPVTLVLGAVAEGPVQVVVRDVSGAVLDAVERPMRVVPSARRGVVEAVSLVEGRGALDVEVPADATPLDGHVRLLAGPAIFEASSDPVWHAWSEALGAPEASPASGARIAEGGPSSLWLGGAYGNETVDDARLRLAMESIAGGLGPSFDASASPRAGLEASSWALLGLAPALASPERRPALASDLRALAERLRRAVADGAASVDDEPEVMVLAAAALAAGGGASTGPRVTELLRRLERSVVEVGADVWLPVRGRPVRATLLLAVAELGLGHRARAFALLSTVQRWARLGHALGPDEAGLGRYAALRLGRGVRPTQARVAVDGVSQDIVLTDGTLELDAAALAVPGRHRVEVSIEASGSEPEGSAERAPVQLGCIAHFGLPWSRAVQGPGPFHLALEGAPEPAPGAPGLSLVVANRLPRWIAAPTVTVSLPTGAEWTADAQALARRTVRASELDAGTLTWTLRALPPGAEVRIPLPLRFSVPGTLVGPGVEAHAADRPADVSVLVPQPMVIEGAAP